jgi:hypothetical protein
MTSFFTRIASKQWRKLIVVCSLFLAACVSAPPTPPTPPSAPLALPSSAGPFPGDAKTYGFGVSQRKEDFENVEVAQLNFGMYKNQRSWAVILPESRGSTRYASLPAYYPFDVRWKLKDGREFIVENVDTAALMREYFKTHQILLQHQRENRPRHPVGDFDPSVVVGVKDDKVVVKWLLVLNGTAIDKRLPVIVNGKPAMDGTPWKLEDEEHYVTSIPVKPTSGIDFKKQWEFLK